MGDLMLTGKKPYPIWLADHPGQKYKGKGWKGWTGFFKDTLQEKKYEKTEIH